MIVSTSGLRCFVCFNIMVSQCKRETSGLDGDDDTSNGLDETLAV